MSTLAIHCRHGARRPVFRFISERGRIEKCWGCALLHPPVVGRALRMALVVGTVLAGINYGDLVLRGEWSILPVAKILLTYCVPFVVATWSALATCRIPSTRGAESA